MTPKQKRQRDSIVEDDANNSIKKHKVQPKIEAYFHLDLKEGGKVLSKGKHRETEYVDLCESSGEEIEACEWTEKDMEEGQETPDLFTPWILSCSDTAKLMISLLIGGDVVTTSSKDCLNLRLVSKVMFNLITTHPQFIQHFDIMALYDTFLTWLLLKTPKGSDIPEPSFDNLRVVYNDFYYAKLESDTPLDMEFPKKIMLSMYPASSGQDGFDVKENCGWKKSSTTRKVVKFMHQVANDEKPDSVFGKDIKISGIRLFVWKQNALNFNWNYSLTDQLGIPLSDLEYIKVSLGHRMRSKMSFDSFVISGTYIINEDQLSNDKFISEISSDGESTLAQKQTVVKTASKKNDVVKRPDSEYIYTPYVYLFPDLLSRLTPSCFSSLKVVELEKFINPHFYVYLPLPPTVQLLKITDAFLSSLSFQTIMETVLVYMMWSRNPWMQVEFKIANRWTKSKKESPDSFTVNTLLTKYFVEIVYDLIHRSSSLTWKQDQSVLPIALAMFFDRSFKGSYHDIYLWPMPNQRVGTPFLPYCCGVNEIWSSLTSSLEEREGGHNDSYKMSYIGGNNPLGKPLLSAYCTHPEAVEILFLHGASKESYVSEVSSGNTIFHDMCHKVDVDASCYIFKRWIERYGEDIYYAQNKYGETPIGYSIMKLDGFEYARVLLSLNLNPTLALKGVVPLRAHNKRHVAIIKKGLAKTDEIPEVLMTIFKYVPNAVASFQVDIEDWTKILTKYVRDGLLRSLLKLIKPLPHVIHH